MDKTPPKKRVARCVLCQSCANWTGRHDVERRQTRICGAGLNPTRALFDCESYVRSFVGKPRTLRARGVDKLTR